MTSSTPADPQIEHLTREQYDAMRGQAPRVERGMLLVGDRRFDARALLACPGCVPVAVSAVMQWTERYAALTHAANPAQLPALLFDASGDPWPLAHYFPGAGILADEQRAAWFAQVGAVAAQPQLDVRLMGESQHDVTSELPASARWLVAGHVVEVLGQRPDILQAFLSRSRKIRLYTSARAFEDDGGIAGGDYDAANERVQIGLGRLFEGFGGQRPGVAPFLHELGHMFDAFHVATGELGRAMGLLPGLAPEDGPLYDAEARRLFSEGKALEARRYEDLRSARAGAGADRALPIGHPYVFQNDGEFIAGYLELFLRTPRRFAALNPQLYGALARLLRQDPRAAWPEDFGYYVRENEAAYLPGKPLGPSGISIPTP
ncbi:MAG TPA: hypothetical protein VF818_00815 [Ktedonobacterales bacterium]